VAVGLLRMIVLNAWDRGTVLGLRSDSTRHGRSRLSISVWRFENVHLIALQTVHGQVAPLKLLLMSGTLAYDYSYTRTHSLGPLSETSRVLEGDSKPAYEFDACQST
jgi:hypothetical protein